MKMKLRGMNQLYVLGIHKSDFDLKWWLESRFYRKCNQRATNLAAENTTRDRRSLSLAQEIEPYIASVQHNSSFLLSSVRPFGKPIGKSLVG